MTCDFDDFRALRGRGKIEIIRPNPKKLKPQKQALRPNPQILNPAEIKTFTVFGKNLGKKLAICNFSTTRNSKKKFEKKVSKIIFVQAKSGQKVVKIRAK